MECSTGKIQIRVTELKKDQQILLGAITVVEWHHQFNPNFIGSNGILTNFRHRLLAIV